MGAKHATSKPRRVDADYSADTYKLVVLVAVVSIVLSAGVGLAIGLNIHPPDQHELERGYDLGKAEGVTVGYTTGYADAESKGKQEISRLMEQIGRELKQQEKKLNAECSTEIKSTEAECLNRIESAKQESFDRGVTHGEESSLGKNQSAISSLKQEFNTKMTERLARVEKEYYDKGLLAGGYQVGYNEGLQLGFDQGQRKAEAACVKAIDEARSQARKWGFDEGVTEGKRLGFDLGMAEGHKRGFAEGKDVGHRDGYQDGYKDGWRAAGGR